MKLFKRKCHWFMVVQFILITAYFWAFHFHAYLLDLINSKAILSSPLMEDIFYSPRSTVVNKWIEDFSISGQNICKQTKPYLLLLVLTVPNNTEKRNAMRETWIRSNNWPNFKSSITIKTVFFFGKYQDNKENNQVVNENAKHGDIVVGNFVDSYRNLTLKVLTGLTWVKRYCAGAKFVAKMDDDTFVNIPFLYKHLQAIPRLNYTILGYLVMNARPERKGKYFVSYQSFPFNFYPPYTTGNMYIATPDTFSALLEVAPHQPRIEMEDVFITGILAKVAKVQHRAYPRGMYFTGKAATACEFVKNTKLLSKNYDGKSVREAMKLIKNPKENCK